MSQVIIFLNPKPYKITFKLFIWISNVWLTFPSSLILHFNEHTASCILKMCTTHLLHSCFINKGVYVSSVFSNGQNIVISVKVLWATTKGHWLMHIGLFCIDSQYPMHGNPAVIGTIKTTIATTSQTILITHAKTLACSLSRCMECYWFTQQMQQLCHIHHPWLNQDEIWIQSHGSILIGCIDHFQFSTQVVSLQECKSVLSNLCPALFSRHASKDSHDLSSA